MASFVKQVIDGYNNIWELRDMRVEDWPFMSSPLPTFTMCVTFVLIVKVWGPNYMKNRPAFHFRNTLIFYNLFQVIFSAWIVRKLLRNGWGWGGHYSLRCEPVDYSEDPNGPGIGMADACWWYFFSKFTEFFDTFFFVMRKKFDQVSLLHVVHHSIMPMSVWFGIRFTPGGHSSFFALLNSSVHVVMYFYYMVAAMGPKYAKFIWWKKYLTVLQMIQFVGIFTHAFQLFFIECDYPVIFAWWIGGHGVLFLVLFSNFFNKSYVAKDGKKSQQTVEANGNHKSSNGHQSSNGKIHDGKIAAKSEDVRQRTTKKN